ncbi:hypothetical protein N7535_002051 [Penicillium sp. DV-2018c]|nr:hypothetical protein N7461_004705 [Penicillium sp. DV-2018c]KAJ5583431.1 hypothetical protein N7535_002051 [Penicillium sp. DV-2018c]
MPASHEVCLRLIRNGRTRSGTARLTGEVKDAAPLWAQFRDAFCERLSHTIHQNHLLYDAT